MVAAAGREALGRDFFDPCKVALRQLDPGRRDVLFQIGAALGARYRDHVFPLREHPRERELARRDLFLVRDLLDPIDDLEILLDIFALEARREPPSHIVSRQIAEGAAQKPAPERAERHESNPEFAQRGNHVVLVVAGPERILRLERGYRMSRMRPADSFHAGLGEAEKTHFTLAHQVRHRANRLLDRHLLIHAMLVIEIDMIDAEALERRVAGGAHVLGPAVDRALAVGEDLVAELGRDYHPAAMSRERLADQLFVVPGAIDVRSVEEVYPELNRALDRCRGFAVVARTVKLRHPHASEAQFRNLESLIAKLSSFHGLILSP